MITPELREKIAVDYCKENRILIINGRISQDKVSEVLDHVNERMKVMAKRTREQEAKDRLRIGFVDIEKALPPVWEYESPLEEFMARGLARNGLLRFFRPQFKIGKYRADLACEKAMLVVECDGHKYHFTEKSQIERDQKRDKYLSRKGWRILHFEGIAIRRNMDFCIQKVKDSLGDFLTVNS